MRDNPNAPNTKAEALYEKIMTQLVGAKEQLRKGNIQTMEINGKTMNAGEINDKIYR
eukprot:UN02381